MPQLCDIHVFQSANLAAYRGVMNIPAHERLYTESEERQWRFNKLKEIIDPQYPFQPNSSAHTTYWDKKKSKSDADLLARSLAYAGENQMTQQYTQGHKVTMGFYDSGATSEKQATPTKGVTQVYYTF